MERSVGVAALKGFWVPLVLALSCGGPQEPAGEGESCYRDADCAPGLVCVPGESGRNCSRDVSGLISQVERPEPPPEPEPDAGTPVDDAAAPMDDAATEPPADGG
jgi:hypothetical protein